MLLRLRYNRLTALLTMLWWNRATWFEVANVSSWASPPTSFERYRHGMSFYRGVRVGRFIISVGVY